LFTDISTKYKPEENRNNVYMKPLAPLRANLKEEYFKKQ
jgi:hypothetical protein